MSFRRSLAALSLFAGLAAQAPAAQADLIWNLSGVTFSDGGTASGSFVTSDVGILQSWSLQTTGGNFGHSYVSGVNSGIDFAVSGGFLVSDGGEYYLGLFFDNNLWAASSPVSLLTDPDESGYEFSPTLGRLIVGGFTAAAAEESVDAPEPASLLLLGAGLAGLAAARGRRADAAPEFAGLH